MGGCLDSECWDWVVAQFRELGLGGCSVQRVGIGWWVSSESWDWVVGEFRELGLGGCLVQRVGIGWLLRFRVLGLGGCLVQRVGIGWLLSSESWYWVVGEFRELGLGGW